MTKLYTSRDELILAIADRDGWACAHPDCGKELSTVDGLPESEQVTIDHWNPLSNGGSWDLSNLKLMHKRCNASKGDVIPNPDGSLPPRPKRHSIPRAVKRANRPEVCDTCMSGRILNIGETCPDCGSGPQPAMAPRSLQVSPKDCDHAVSHCWLCYLNFVPRTAAIITVLDGEYLDGD